MNLFWPTLSESMGPPRRVLVAMEMGQCMWAGAQDWGHTHYIGLGSREIQLEWYIDVHRQDLAMETH